MSSPEPDQPEDVNTTPHGPYSGWIDTTYDALLVYEAASRGVIPRITRRLTANERALIGSGTIFVYDERESGIKRWTDGYTWSPSRAQNNFFLYREVLSRSPNSPNKSTVPPPKVDAGPEGTIDEQCCYSEEVKVAFENDRNLEKTLVGSLRNSYTFKVGGMMKKTISFCVKGVVSHHIVSYYTLEDIIAGRLIRVSDIPEIRVLVPSSIYMDNLEVLNFPPKTIKTEEGVVRYISEADDIDKSRAGRPKDHPHVRAEEKAREHNFGFDEDGQLRHHMDSTTPPVTYSRYEPYYRRKSGSSSAYSGEDEPSSQMPAYYYPPRGPGPSRRPGGSTNGYSNYQYPYDPYTAYHQWYTQQAQQAAYYASYPSGPYGYSYPYPPYYPDPRYGPHSPMEPRSPGEFSVGQVEKPYRGPHEDEPKAKGKKYSLGAAPAAAAPEPKGVDVERPHAPGNVREDPKVTPVESGGQSNSLSPLTPPNDDEST